MKTNLHRTITTVEEAKAFLSELYLNGEAYHPDDAAQDISFSPPITSDQCDQLDTLMDSVLAVPEFDPYYYLMEMEFLHNKQKQVIKFDSADEVEAQFGNYVIFGCIDITNSTFIPVKFGLNTEYEIEILNEICKAFYNQNMEHIDKVILDEWRQQRQSEPVEDDTDKCDTALSIARRICSQNTYLLDAPEVQQIIAAWQADRDKIAKDKD